MPEPHETARLDIRGLSKTFAGVTVLRDAHVSFMPGELHAIVGQNGSGKSTLIKLISAVYRPDPGADVLVDGQRIGPPIDPRKLHDAGLSFVHQDLGLVPDLTVAENVRVGRHAVNPLTRWIRKPVDREAVRRTFETLGLDIDPDAKVSTLLPSEKVAVAIARALQDRTPGTGVVVFDESSRAIPHEAIDEFYGMVRRLAEQGTTVVFVSHNLAEVLKLADRATILRNGSVVQTGIPTAELDEATLTSLVLGRSGDLGDIYDEIPTALTGQQVTLRGITGGRIAGLDATIGRGEVVGFTGTVDSGLADLGPVLAGDRVGSGTIAMTESSVDLDRSKPADLLRAGVAFIPADRHGKGLATALTVEENATIPHLRTRGRSWWTGKRWQREETERIIERFDVRPPDRKAVVAQMSGGNQQKVLFGKWLLGGPELLVLDDPTQAVDVGARHAVLSASRQAAADGAAVALCSPEVEDLAAVCDRVYVLVDGQVVRELQRPFDADTILASVFDSEVKA
ncbi:MAG: sugar ABC transporter ATP-binding protein [Microbacteriaceae bacterium]|nr:sugar ABC transporter ATP-binding protein [Microbacteriaceae bacterium]